MSPVCEVYYLHDGIDFGHAVSEHADCGCRGQNRTTGKSPRFAQNAYCPFHWMKLSTVTPDD